MIYRSIMLAKQLHNVMICIQVTNLYSPKVSSFMGRASESIGPSSLSFTEEEIIGFHYQEDLNHVLAKPLTQTSI